MAEVPFRLGPARTALARTPAVLDALLRGLPDAWLHTAPDPGTWTPHEVVAHLVDGERTDWTVRARQILAAEAPPTFAPYDRAASLAAADAPTDALLATFAEVRSANVAWLADAVTEADLDRRGVHPSLGPVTLRQLLAAWVAHDHGHVVQVARTLARQSRAEVGPWTAFLSVFSR